MAVKTFKIIGLGGIGTYLIDPICRYLCHNCGDDSIEVTLIDGDTYEEKNRSRQQFSRLDNKAAVTCEALREKFPTAFFRSKAEYITPDNVIRLIREDDTVFLCVDNHATRKLVSDRCEELPNVTLISGGNDHIDGNVIYYRRASGKDITKSLTALHREIAAPNDHNPGEMTIDRQGCEREVEEFSQLIFTNLAVASHMCNVYYAHTQGLVKFEQVYFDIEMQRARPTP